MHGGDVASLIHDVLPSLTPGRVQRITYDAGDSYDPIPQHVADDLDGEAPI